MAHRWNRSVLVIYELEEYSFIFLRLGTAPNRRAFLEVNHLNGVQWHMTNRMVVRY